MSAEDALLETGAMASEDWLLAEVAGKLGIAEAVFDSRGSLNFAVDSSPMGAEEAVRVSKAVFAEVDDVAAFSPGFAICVGVCVRVTTGTSTRLCALPSPPPLAATAVAPGGDGFPTPPSPLDLFEEARTPSAVMPATKTRIPTTRAVNRNRFDGRRAGRNSMGSGYWASEALLLRSRNFLKFSLRLCSKTGRKVRAGRVRNRGRALLWESGMVTWWKLLPLDCWMLLLPEWRRSRHEAGLKLRHVFRMALGE